MFVIDECREMEWLSERTLGRTKFT